MKSLFICSVMSLFRETTNSIACFVNKWRLLAEHERDSGNAGASFCLQLCDYSLYNNQTCTVWNVIVDPFGVFERKTDAAH